MSHHFKAKGGTHFNFNSDLSGDVRVHRSAEHDDRAELPAADLLEFVEWYRREYGRTADLSDDTVLTSHWSVTCEECRAQGVSSHREDCSQRPRDKPCPR